MLSLVLERYPKLLETMARRHEGYNRQTDYVRRQEAAGKCIVIRPPHKLDVKQVERDPDKLRAAYQLGRDTALDMLEAIRAFVKEEKP